MDVAESVTGPFGDDDVDIDGVAGLVAFEDEFVDLGVCKTFGAVEVADTFAPYPEIILDEGGVRATSIGSFLGGAQQHGDDAFIWKRMVSVDGDISDDGPLTFADVEIERSVLDDSGHVGVIEAVVLVEDTEIERSILCGGIRDGCLRVFEIVRDPGELFFDGLAEGRCVKFAIADEVDGDFFGGFSLAEDGAEDG